MARAGSPRGSLAHRLPNPPALFVGRQAELAELRAAIARGPATLVCGAGGMGKSALVSVLVTREHAGDLDRVIAVGLDDRWPGSLAARIGRPLRDRVGAGDVSAAALLDAAEDAAAWLVIDDLHHAPAGERDELVTVVCRHARRSRWTFTSRHRPDIGELAGQIVALGPLGDADSRQLARALAADTPDEAIAAAIRRAAGSPWRLRQILYHGVAQPGEHSDLLVGLGGAERACLEVLALAEQPLAATTLSAACGASRQTLDDLAERALVRRRGDAWELHDVTRRDLEDRPASGRRFAPSLRAALAIEPVGSTAVLELIRLAIADGARGEVLRWLDERGELMLGEGHGPEMWALLRGDASADLASWRWRFGVELGARAFDELAPPDDDAPARDQLLWARLCLRCHRGDHGEAAAAAVAARPDADAELRADAELVRVRARLARGDLAGARTALEAARVDGPREVLRRALLADVLLAMGERTTASQQVDDVLARVSSVPAGLRFEVIKTLARSLADLGRLRDLEPVVDTDVISLPRAPGRARLYAQELLAIDRGDLVGARAIAARLEPGAPPHSLSRALALARIALRLGAGELDRVESQIALAHLDLRDARARAELGALARATAIARGVPPGPADAAAPPPGNDAASTIAALAHAEHQIRHGIDAGVPVAPPHAARAAGIEARVRAIHAAAGGQLAQARVHAEEAIRRAAASGHGLLELEARLVACDLAAADRASAAGHAGQLAERAARLGSARYQGEARFHLDAAAGPGPSALLALLGDRAAPVAARRLRALLGAAAPLDRIDRAVVDQLAAGWRWRAVSPDALADAPTWIIDVARTTVTRPDGAEVSLAAHPLLFQLLVETAGAGEASKEQLFERVWGDGEYHPLRHDNRIKVAIRKLRVALADDRLLETRPGGYAVGGCAIVG